MLPAGCLAALPLALYPSQRPPAAPGDSTSRKNRADKEGGRTRGRPASRGGDNATIRPRSPGAVGGRGTALGEGHGGDGHFARRGAGRPVL